MTEPEPRSVEMATADQIQALQDSLSAFTPGLEPRVEDLEAPSNVVITAATADPDEPLLDLKNHAGVTLIKGETQNAGSQSVFTLTSNTGTNQAMLTVDTGSSWLTLVGPGGRTISISIQGDGLQVDFGGGAGTSPVRIRDNGLQLTGGDGSTWYRVFVNPGSGMVEAEAV